MGYYTDFKIETNATEEVNQNIMMHLREISGYDWYNFNLSDAKWYDHHNDMIKLSKVFPNVEFKVHGDGEESDDVWIIIYKNGKSKQYEPIITWPEINFDDVN